MNNAVPLAVSVIVSTHNRSAVLLRAMEAWMKQTLAADRFELIVVASQCTDDTETLTLKFMETHKEYQCRFVRQDKNGGWTLSRHAGAALARGNYLVFCDDDMIVCSTYLESLLREFENSAVGLVEGKTLPEYDPAPPAWAEKLWQETPYGNAISEFTLIDFGEKAKEIPAEYAWGSNFGTRRNAFFECGGFGPDGFGGKYVCYNGLGEYFLADNLKKNGYRIQYSPALLGRHVISARRFRHEYFVARGFYNGIFQSFLETRHLGRVLSEEECRSRLERFQKRKGLRKILKAIFSRAENLKQIQEPLVHVQGLKSVLGKLPELSEKNIGTARQLMYQAHVDGYLYHQKKLREDKDLINYVTQKNWLNYDFSQLKPEASSELLPSLW